jgi:hypothetical protein
VSDHDEEFLEDLDSIAAILADGYLRYRKNHRKIYLIPPPKRALMDTRLTPPRKKEKDLQIQIQIQSQIEALRRMTVRDLRGRYACRAPVGSMPWNITGIQKESSFGYAENPESADYFTELTLADPSD